ncbi:Formate dehydrogenase subunit gamma [Candidatus Filomicrobium marinum]|uniref:Formate dehydrogenase subunit gamma n=2 Tax=Filomicrobium TaxID=119044 RepID=A0A0D6JH49_9HYPH|nr:MULTISPECIES: formate dehydrogenase subunit gamma [Filomicrobium]MCV0369559.1 formate dehydrogenase subunit gamma [Filomicrobium sp.]CFX45068.1 Formate dehydrogenase subunit gamma [Candidatus Filomicrobium marinum]CPR20802.1 Formate dehydrogenase subunit gamma [Candidatus Filomicrobium marinum]SDP19413.1 formate dehydrogenase subunit gamma [Filomicrobium insigne]
MPRHDAWNESETLAIVSRHAHREGPLLPILHEVQETFGCVPEAAVPVIAQALNLSRAEVHGCVTFYHDFRDAPAGHYVLKVCRAEACQAMGCESLVKKAEDRIGVACGETTPDGRVTLEAVYCLGLCATAPSAMFDGRLIGRLDVEKLEAILGEAGA